MQVAAYLLGSRFLEHWEVSMTTLRKLSTAVAATVLLALNLVAAGTLTADEGAEEPWPPNGSCYLSMSGGQAHCWCGFPDATPTCHTIFGGCISNETTPCANP
jgi:hypothetical protein